MKRMLEEELVPAVIKHGDVLDKIGKARREKMNQLEFYKSKPEDFSINKHKQKDLYIIKYKHPQVDWSDEWTRQARGIVLDGDSNVISRPYEKFFNYKELEWREDIDKDTKKLSEWEKGQYTVIEKLDGSLAIVSQYEDDVLYTSSGSLQGKFPHMFKAWFDKNLTPRQKRNLKSLTKSYTLMFEYIGPDNRIVVPYKRTQMILHGVINTETGKELFDEAPFNKIAEDIGVGTANRMGQIELESLMRVKKQDFTDNLFEGFVVRFESGKRLKIKTDHYVELHSDHTLGFGAVDTKSKTRLYIERIKDDTIDDLIAIMTERRDRTAVDYINKVIAKYNKFDKLIEESKNIVSDKNFTKRDYAVNIGSDDWIDKLVLNHGKENKIETMRVNFILDELGD